MVQKTPPDSTDSILFLLGQLSRDVQHIKEHVATSVERVTTSVNDHESRIRYLERGFWRAVGGAGIIATVGLYAVNILGKLL